MKAWARGNVVVEITDEQDELVGYGVCVVTIDADGNENYAMRPEVCGGRTDAHILAAKR